MQFSPEAVKKAAAVLNLEDLVPKEAEFTLRGRPGVTLKLRPWSILVRKVMLDRLGGREAIKEIFDTQDPVRLSDMAYEMLQAESKKLFSSLNDFQDAILGLRDVASIMKALLATIGIGEPELAAIESLKIEPEPEGDTDPK